MPWVRGTLGREQSALGVRFAAVCTCTAVWWPTITSTSTSWYEQKIEKKIEKEHTPVLVLDVVVAYNIED